MNELSQAIAQEKDKLLFELFKKHGYSRKKVMDAFTRGTVKMMTQENRETYHIDGKELFTIEYIVENKAETVVPDVPTEKTTHYTVMLGDTLSGICGRFGVKMDDVVRWNNISNPNVILVGKVLKLVGTANNVVTLTVNANGGLRLRETPNGTIMLVMPNGSLVEKIGADGNWYKVNYNGKTGYCHSGYLK